MLCDPIDLIWREGTPFEAITGRTDFIDGLLAEVFRGFSLAYELSARRSEHSPWYHLITTLVVG